MRISIFGLGYVGTVSAACLAQMGNIVIGVDIDPIKVKLVNIGKSPVIEKDLEPLISSNVKAGRLRATTDSNEAIQGTETSLICVGTPSAENGNIDLTYLKRVSREIGMSLAIKDSYYLVVIRSTVLPRTVEENIIPILERYSGKQAGKDFGVAFNPEFLREGTAVYDFFHPPKIVIGSMNADDAEKVAQLYKGIDAPLFQTNIKTAEMVKYVDNVFHALKVTFANEIGLICKSLNIDSHEVMNIFCQDTKLNLSPYYLKPGFAFGGSCLPKDLRALTYLARHRDLNLPVINAIIPSNQSHIQYALELIRKKGKKRIGFLGFAFKAETDDLRESPIVTLIEILLGQGFEIQIYDKNVNLARLTGANKRFIEEKIPHIAALMRDDINEVISFAEIIVIGNKCQEFTDILPRLQPHQHILDLVRIAKKFETKAKYEGICW